MADEASAAGLVFRAPIFTRNRVGGRNVPAEATQGRAAHPECQSLFVAKRNQGIDLRSAACGDVTRQQRNSHKQQWDS